MKRRSFFTVVSAALASVLGYVSNRQSALASSADSSRGMMGNMDMGGMMSRGNMTGPMRTGMALFRHHAQVTRHVTDIPGGVRAETVSKDPAIASLIQRHVAEMYARLDTGRPFPYPASRSVPALFAHAQSYRRALEILPDGVAVTETSTHPEMAAVIRAHAREVSGFVSEGMPAMMRDMMGR